MRIGFDLRMYSSNFTGIGRYAFEIVNRFIELNKKEGYKHEFVLFFNEPEYSKFKESKNVKKVLANAKHYSLKEQIHFAKALYKEKLDLVHFMHFNVPLFYRKPYITTIHDLTLSLFPGKKMTKFYHRLAYHLIIKNAVRKSKKIITISENTKNDMLRLLRVDEKKIKVIYHGVGKEFKFIQDAKKFNATLKKYKITLPFLLYTGNWRSHKNLVRLIKAFKKIKETDQSNLKLVITGKENPIYPEVKATIKELNLEKEVVLPGLVSESELIILYNAALIYVFPSLYEGFGWPPLESMACGTPVAAAFSSSIPEICGENAIYFNPYNVDDIAKKIIDLKSDTKKMTELIDKGIQHVKSFDWDKAAKDSYNFLKSALK